MRATSVLLAAAALPILSNATAQEIGAAFDVPVIAFPDSTSITSVGDFDGDGDVDAVGWYWTHWPTTGAVTIRAFLNDGAGVFTVAGGGSANVGSSNNTDPAWDTEVGRFAGGTRDAWVAIFERDVQVFVHDLPNGNAKRWQTWTEAWSVEDAAVADFDGDGYDDLALIGQEIRLYRSTGTSLVHQASFALAGEEIRAADLDGDGTPELWVPLAPAIRVLHVDGSGIRAGALLTPNVQLNEKPMHVAGDVDGDGDVDLVVFTEGWEYVTLRNGGAGTFRVEPRVSGGPATGLADIDGDGDLDGVCCGGGGPTPAHNTMAAVSHVAINDGGGRFRAAYTLAGFGAFRLAGAPDIDGDGDLDLVAGRTILFNQGTFGVDPRPDVPALPAKSVVYDQDGDGDPDIVQGHSAVRRNDGSGGFTAVVPLAPPPPAGTFYRGLGHHGDFDGDGDVDVIVGHVQGLTVLGMRLMLNNGGGGYEDGGYAAAPGVRFRHSTSLFDFGELSIVFDVDGDGDQDIVAGNLLGLIVNVVWLNDGSGFFTRGAQFFTTPPQAASDLDGDGKLDLITGSQVFFGNGDGTFTSGYVLGTRPDRLDVGDLDNNGFADIVAVETASGVAGDLHVHWNEGGRVFHRSVYALGATTSSSDETYTYVLDCDGDGNLDVLAGPTFWYDGDNAIVLFGDGARGFSRRALQVLHPRGLADVDGDGDLDVLESEVARLARRNVPLHGYRRQYGAAVPGLGRMTPTLGAVGPFTSPGNIALRITGAPGGAPVAIGFGATETALEDWPWTGLTAHTLPIFTVGLTAAGPPGPGCGAAELPIPVPPALVGLRLFQQAWLLDVSVPGMLTHTNGLELRFGLPAPR